MKKTKTNKEQEQSSQTTHARKPEGSRPATDKPATNAAGEKGLPTGWVEVELKQVCEPVKKINPGDKPNEKFLYIDISSIDNQVNKINSPQELLGSKAPSRARQLVKTGDTVFSTVRTYLRNIAIVEDELDGQVASTGFAVIRPVPAIERKYIYYYAISDAFIEPLNGLQRGASYPAVRNNDVFSQKIPLPPLPEQHRIVSRLDALLARAAAARERLERMPELLRQFRQSVLARAYSGKLTKEWRMSNRHLNPVRDVITGISPPKRPPRFKSRTKAIIPGDFAISVGNPKTEVPPKWEWVLLIDVARLETGHTPSRKHPEYWEGDIPWIGIQDARENHASTVQDTRNKTNELGLANSAARLLPENTICLSRTASVGYVVKMGRPMATSQDFVNWICTDAINPDWLKFLFVAEKEAILRFGRGTTHTTVYFPEVMSFHVMLPPLEEQQEIVRRVEALFAIADRIEEGYEQVREQVEALPQAVLAKAFRGELVEQDAGDEPAGELLRRITKEK